MGRRLRLVTSAATGDARGCHVAHPYIVLCAVAQEDLVLEHSFAKVSGAGLEGHGNQFSEKTCRMWVRAVLHR